MNTVKTSVTFLLFVALFLTLFFPRPAPKEKAPFSIEEISSSLPHDPQFEVQGSDPHAPEVQKALTQPYRYLGSGGQCYTFVSQDDQYVIKFFKQKKFAIPAWIDRFPLPFLVQGIKQKYERKRGERRHAVYSASKLAFEHLHEETGLLFVHLNPTTSLQKSIPLTDPKGQPCLVDLDPLPFVLQRKAVLASSMIDTLMQNGEEARAKEAIDKILHLAVSFYQKGYRNRDPNLRSNFGFIGTEPILIDMGRMVVSEEIKTPANYAKELIRIAPRFRKYLAAKHPTLVPYFDQKVANVVTTHQPPL